MAGGVPYFELDDSVREGDLLGEEGGYEGGKSAALWQSGREAHGEGLDGCLCILGNVDFNHTSDCGLLVFLKVVVHKS